MLVILLHIRRWRGRRWSQYSQKLAKTCFFAETYLANIIIGDWVGTAEERPKWYQCLHRAQGVLKDNTHPSRSLFTLLPSGKIYTSICCDTTSFRIIINESCILELIGNFKLCLHFIIMLSTTPQCITTFSTDLHNVVAINHVHSRGHFQQKWWN